MDRICRQSRSVSPISSIHIRFSAIWKTHSTSSTCASFVIEINIHIYIYIHIHIQSARCLPSLVATTWKRRTITGLHRTSPDHSLNTERNSPTQQTPIVRFLTLNRAHPDRLYRLFCIYTNIYIRLFSLFLFFSFVRTYCILIMLGVVLDFFFTSDAVIFSVFLSLFRADLRRMFYRNCAWHFSLCLSRSRIATDIRPARKSQLKVVRFFHPSHIYAHVQLYFSLCSRLALFFGNSF